MSKKTDPALRWLYHYHFHMRKASKLYHAQGGRCCYCETPMWETVRGIPTRSQSAKPFMMMYDMPYEQVKYLLNTVEHLTGQKDGGGHEPDNLAAACNHCNSKRFGVDYTIDPHAYKEYVIKQMKRDVWFAFTVHDKFEYVYTRSLWDKMVGVVLRRIRWVKNHFKKLKRSYIRAYPKSMTKLQFIQSYIRSIRG